MPKSVFVELGSGTEGSVGVYRVHTAWRLRVKNYNSSGDDEAFVRVRLTSLPARQEYCERFESKRRNLSNSREFTELTESVLGHYEVRLFHLRGFLSVTGQVACVFLE